MLDPFPFCSRLLIKIWPYYFTTTLLTTLLPYLVPSFVYLEHSIQPQGPILNGGHSPHPTSSPSSHPRSGIRLPSCTAHVPLLPLLLLVCSIPFSPGSTDLQRPARKSLLARQLLPTLALSTMESHSTSHGSAQHPHPPQFNRTLRGYVWSLLPPLMLISTSQTKASACVFSRFWQLQEHSLVRKCSLSPVVYLTSPSPPPHTVLALQFGSSHLVTIDYGRKKGQESFSLMYNSICFQMPNFFP